MAQERVTRSPTVNDMANLLAQAMRRPSDEDRRRPRTIRLRARRSWQELLPHLAQLGIQVITTPRLAVWEQAYEEYRQEAAKVRAKPPAAP